MATQHNFRIKNGLEVAGSERISSSGAMTPQSLTVAADAGIGGNLVVTGNLTVNGTNTILNTSTLDVEDKNITLNKGSGDTSSTADGAGITIQDAVNSSTDASMLWNSASDRFNFSNDIGFQNSAGNIIYDGSSGGTTRTAKIEFYNSSDGSLNLATHNSAGGGINLSTQGTERMRIDISGNVGIGNTAPSNYYSTFDDLVIGSGGSHGITVVSGTSGAGTLSFADGTSGDAAYRGYIQYNHSNDKLVLGSAGNDRLHIDSSGSVGIGNSTPSSFQSSANNLVIGSGVSGDNTGLTIYSNSDSSGSIHFADSTSGTDSYVGDIYYNHASNFMAFLTNATERLRINNTGNVGIGNAPVVRFDVSSTTFGLPNTSGTTANGMVRIGYNDRTWGGNEIMLGIINASAQNYAGYIQSKVPTDQSANRPFLINPQGGNVGIGTNNPGNRLTVAHENHGVAVDYVGSLPSIAGIFTSSSGLSQTAYGDLNIKARTDYGGNYSIGFFTASSNNTPALRMRINSGGSLIPAGNNLYNLGETTNRFANIFTNDLNLSNEGTGGNDVDGTEGNWTIQEGKTDLYIINNKNGKKYKFALEEL